MLVKRRHFRLMIHVRLYICLKVLHILCSLIMCLNSLLRCPSRSQLGLTYPIPTHGTYALSDHLRVLRKQLPSFLLRPCRHEASFFLTEWSDHRLPMIMGCNWSCGHLRRKNLRVGYRILLAMHCKVWVVVMRLLRWSSLDKS